MNRRARLSALAAFVAAPLAATALPAHAVVGTPAATGDYTFTARLDIGDGQRACSGALVAPMWVVTAASCFAGDPATDLTVPAGKPPQATTATIGRTDLTSAAGAVRDVVELVPRTDRDLVLARLAKPVNNITPVSLSDTAPSAGDELTVAGYGRTTDEWAPLKMHTGTFDVDTAPTTAELNITGKDGAAVCKGDTGGPTLTVTNGKAKLVAVNSRSWQGGCFGIDETRTGALNTRTDDLAAWIEKTVTAGPVTDFNCDGQRDVAIGDPKATVGADAEAGLVRVSYGNDKGTAEISEDMATVPGGAEPGDQFGETMATVDYNLDGCTDLIAGAWHENLRGEANAGLVTLIYGSPDGLGEGKNGEPIQQAMGGGGLGAAIPEAGDHLGYALAAGTTTDGDPYILVGAPGEDYDGVSDIGVAYYLRDGKNVTLGQGALGYAGTPQEGDHFGAAIAASPEHIAIGAPDESVNGDPAGGMVQILSHELNTDGLPTAVRGLDEDSGNVNGGAEDGDQFGASLAMIPYRPAGSPVATDSIVAIGTPGEGIEPSAPHAGRVVTMHVTASGTVRQISDIQQDIPGVTGGSEENDHFGEQVTAINTSPGKASTAQTLLLAVGIPGEDYGATTDAGGVQIFPLLGAPGDSDLWLNSGMYGIPGLTGAGEKMGSSIHATGADLQVGMPYGPASLGSVYTVPWENIIDGATQPVTTYQPGTGGFPAEGKTFGSVVR